MNTTVKNLFTRFCEVYNLKTSATTKRENPTQSDFYSNDFVKMDYVPQYGGYVIMKVHASTSQSSFDSYARMTAKEMIAYLKGLIAAKNSFCFDGITNTEQVSN